MGGGGPTLSSAAGPAKWAAVIVLAFASGAGLTWSAVRGRAQGAVTPALQSGPAVPAGSSKGLGSPKAPVEPPLAPTPTAPKSIAPEPTPAPTPEPTTTPTAPTAPPAQAPPPPPATPLPGAPAKSPSLTHRININTALEAELELLPSVGPALAKRIMDYRALHGPFKAISDLDKVKGIGPKTLAKIAPLVTVD